ncbi:caspase family protein [Planctomicrobium sp. SH664]|uniref:caspase family protein n=1 Tax=Planctomicrobium sp. SH664 TaxID=3448125 RepID=UPI003F5CBBC7
MRQRPSTRRQSRAFVLFCGLFSAVSTAAADTPLSAQSNPVPRFALLVGIDSYPQLPHHSQLQGCVNDTRIMRDVLIERYRFLPEHIVTLSNETATGERIRHELALLQQKVASLPRESAPAQCVFHFSGHGSQIPDQPAGHPDADELDGLDETLVPADATEQGGPQDLRDDEINRFAADLCANGRAQLWLILDCCHSGTGARGPTRFRSLERETNPTRTADAAQLPSVTPQRLPEGVVVLSACQSFEKEPEFQEEGEHYGLLSRFVTQILNQQPTASGLTYDALRESLILQYRQAGVVPAPTPQLEGNGQGVVLAADPALDHPPVWMVRPNSNDPATVTLQAGALHGITTGSLFELYEQPVPTTSIADNGAQPSLTWLEVTGVSGVTATGRLFNWQESEKINVTWPAGLAVGYALERRHDPGTFPLRVRVVRALGRGQDGPALSSGDPVIPDMIQRVLEDAAQPDGVKAPAKPWLHWVNEAESADVLLRISGEQAALFPLIGEALLREKSAGPLTGGWGPIDLRNADQERKLLDMLKQIHRARNLLRVAASGSHSQQGQPQLRLELVRVELDDQFNILSSHVWPMTGDRHRSGSQVVRDGDFYAFRVTNLEDPTTGSPAYITVLHVDSNLGIDLVLPYQPGATEEQLLRPGESRLSDPFQCNGSDDEPRIHGMRHVILLATREPSDFSRLASASLPVARSNLSQSLDPLTELLAEQTEFIPRGLKKPGPPSMTDANSWSAVVLPWLALPK